eukprot:jgi/Chrzof1/13744/Cz08g10140.t1
MHLCCSRYCYTTLTFLFLTDLTPLGQLLTQSDSALINLAAFQWCAFVAPTLWNAKQQGWDLQETFKLKSCQFKWLLAGLGAGPALWLLVTTAISIKTGTWLGVSADTVVGLQASNSHSLIAGSSLLGSKGLNLSSSWKPLLTLISTVAVSPAVAEELLFRGLFLTALQDSLGWVDAVAVCAALFAAIHLSLQQFFSFAVLGFGAGALTVRSNSVYPAILLHGSYNATALVVGLLHELHQ